MKNIHFILLFILLVSCKKESTKINENIPIINNQDMVETNQINEDNDFSDSSWIEIIEINRTIEHNDFLVGGWIKEWDYPFFSFNDTEAFYEINLCKASIYEFYSPVFYLYSNGEYRKPMSGLAGRGSLYIGTWYVENSELIINKHLLDETEENNESSEKYEILLSKNNVLYLLNDNKIEKWVNNVDLHLMVGLLLYWDFETLKDYLDQNNNSILLYERTPLMWSLCNKNWELIDYLIETSKNINSVDIFKRNVAHYVIIEYQKYDQSILIKFLKILKEKGINFEALDIYGKKPYDYFKSGEMKLKIINELD